MTKAENLIDLDARTREVALEVTAALVPSQVGLMDNETARALIHQGILDGVAAVLDGAKGRWEHTLSVEYPLKPGRDGTPYTYYTGRYRQRQRAINELRRFVNNPRNIGVVAKIVRRAVIEGPFRDA